MHFPKFPGFSQSNDGPLLALLTALLYSLFTLLPTSQSLMVAWPWVFIWQISTGLPMLWLLWQLWFKPLTTFRLGQGFDWPIVLLVIGLLISILTAEFPNQARWYAWAALGGLAAIYALRGWLTTPRRTLKILYCQGLLGVGFILLSLGLWLAKIYLPELARLASLEPYGIAQSFDFRLMSLRNWQPMGHQNYVAGYLVLILPLLLGLTLTAKGWQRWFWGIGCLLGLLDLYTTSSRGGLLALVGTVAVAVPLLVWRSRLPQKFTLPLGLLLAIGSLGATLANNRVRGLLTALFQGNINNTQVAYRFITNLIGWRMGLAHPLTGAGPGSVALTYQKYRPYWAGREAELHFQLHSTPAQLWAELGLWGIAALTSLVGLLLWYTARWASHSADDTQSDVQSADVQSGTQRWLHPGLVWSLIAGIFAYGLISLTDYQLDNLGISGVLVIYFVILAKVYGAELKSPPRSVASSPSPLQPESLRRRRLNRWVTGIGLGIVLVMNLWLIPTYRAWAISKQGFTQLNQGNFDGFVASLQRAHQLSPWEPYYPSILAWTLGDFSLQLTDPAQARVVRQDAIQWFQAANAISPYQEFGYSNLGWLLVEENPAEAVIAFTQSVQLVPAKQGVFFGLGLALLRNDQPEQAIDAFVLELLRFPMLMTSPVWHLGQFASVQESVFNQLETVYTRLTTTASDPELVEYIQGLRGALHWWQGDFNAARQDWTTSHSALGLVLLDLVQNTGLTADTLPETLAARDVILAWLLPEERQSLLQKAWIQRQTDLPQLTDISLWLTAVNELVATMNTATSFDDWLKNKAPIVEPRNRRLGFGSLSRHIDGHSPNDYYPQFVNQPMDQFFKTLLFSPTLSKDWDAELQPYREQLINGL